MSTRTVKAPPLRGYRRKKTELNLDLNTPPVDYPDQEGTSNQATSQPVDSVPIIDVETIDDDDDDVAFCSPSAFVEAKDKSQRNRRMETIDVDSERRSGHKRKRDPAGQTSIDFEKLVNLESSKNSKGPVEKPAPPPKEPTFSCPICMGQLVEETSTKCGHIFCKACIRAAIATQAKCPTCRKRVTVKELIRVFLPATNVV